MTRSSIFYSITFIFFLATTSVFLAFLWLMEYDKQNYTKELNTKYSIVARATLFHLNNYITKDELEKQVIDYQMTEIQEEPHKDYIIKNAKVLQEIKAKIGSSSILTYKKHHYLMITHNDSVLLLKDDDFQPYRYDVIKIIFASVFFILLGTYIFTIRKLRPLRKLKLEIDKFARGDLEEVTCSSTGSDEISEVAEAFQNAVTQIKNLNQSRQLFLRNIMHELKTPITKGRITAEMLPENKYQERLITVFEKLETMINEFASIEQLTSGIGLNNITSYRLVDVMDEAIDIAMVSKDAINLNIVEDMVVNVDFKFFSIALKNMIDNGIKYSQDKYIKIVADTHSIRFISRGEPLEHTLEHYLEPFIQGKNSVKSLGLGLYIVDNIVKAHNLKLNYRYQNGFNIFYFENLEALLENSVQ